MTTFYPLWFTFFQSQVASTNRMAGPTKVTNIYHIVVAINVDTIYASSFMDLTQSPVILSVPPYTGDYSILQLDPYGNVFTTELANIDKALGGTFALIGPGTPDPPLPDQITPVHIPLSVTVLIFRIDKFANGQDMTSEAEAFRSAITTEPLCALLGSTCPDGTPSGGKTLVLPEIFFSEPFKEIADALIAADPIAFLKQLHAAVSAPQTPPLTPVEQGIADAFEAVYPNLETDPKGFAEGARAAHALILRTYLNHRDRNNWISFLNIGEWGNDFAQRSTITEFLQYGNSHATAAYYHTFWDSDGNPLDGSQRAGYVLKFPRFQIPPAERFWSLTAYTPDAIELIKNPAQKYVVASYDNPVANPDQSISIFISRTQPPGVPASNWLPVSSRPFNIMLRVYGPKGTVRLGTYVPPAIRSLTR